MASPGLDEVMAFLTEHGFASTASALRDDVLGRTSDGESDSSAALDPRLPPLRMLASASGVGAGSPAPASPGSSSDSASSSAFVSMRSTPSGMLNPYGVWSPSHSLSNASSSELEFGTARQYDTSDLFFQEGWLYDDHLFHTKLDDAGRDKEEDKFVLGAHGGSGRTETFVLNAGDDRRHEHAGNAGCEGCAEVYTCSSPLCGCCRGELKDMDGLEVVRNSSSAVYGRYQIMDDQTEVLDECGLDVFQLKQSEDAVLECDLPRDSVHGDDRDDRVELNVVERELQMLSSFDTTDDADIAAASPITTNVEFDDNTENNLESSRDKEYLKEYSLHPFPETGDSDDAYELGDIGPLKTDVKKSAAPIAEGEEPESNIDLALSNFHREYEVFELRIVHRKNRTGFEENKDFPIVLNSVIAGRYYVTEYLGSAAFSKVAQAHDLLTGMDICLKIIKNDKDFFDQSLDEIKLLKFVNKYDPSDEHHVLRLYDYFYHQEHLFIVTELLRANLYEFQKYNQESGGEVYFTFPRIQAIARQCLDALVYLHHLTIIHCDLKPENILIKSYSRCEIKVIDLGSSCFLTDNLCLYVQSRSYRAPEVILGLPYDQRIDIWSLGCILAELYTGEVLFPNEPVSMMLARMIGVIGPIDTEMLALGQETEKYFTDDYDLFTKNEETDQLEYLVPEKSSLRRHLQCPDPQFVDFLSYLLQINPSQRPTATEALEHPWLSSEY